jgi:hypothetical protein
MKLKDFVTQLDEENLQDAIISLAHALKANDHKAIAEYTTHVYTAGGTQADVAKAQRIAMSLRDEVFESVLNEIGDAGLPTTRWSRKGDSDDDTSYEFKIKKARYETQLVFEPLEHGLAGYEKYYAGRNYTKKNPAVCAMSVSFDMDNWDVAGDRADQNTNLMQQFRVMANVVGQIKKEIAIKKAENIIVAIVHFMPIKSGEKEEEQKKANRRKMLYLAYAKKQLPTMPEGEWDIRLTKGAYDAIILWRKDLLNPGRHLRGIARW